MTTIVIDCQIVAIIFTMIGNAVQSYVANGNEPPALLNISHKDNIVVVTTQERFAEFLLCFIKNLEHHYYINNIGFAK